MRNFDPKELDARWLEDPCRRDWLLRLLVGGALGVVPHQAAQAFWFSSGPDKLDEDQSIHSLEGDAFVNGQKADLNTRIAAGDRVETGADSEIVFAVGGDSFLLRSDSSLQLDGGGFFVRGFRILSGRLLSVFARRDAGQSVAAQTGTATIGIRGTGVYLESEPDLTYVCTCYGQVALAAADDPNDAELITTTNHDMPRYVGRATTGGSQIRPAPVINHSDSELKLLEAIVGRKVPKGFGVKGYTK